MSNQPAPLQDCDVQDKEKLAVYSYFRKQWIDMLNGEDNHAISKQITALLDTDLMFRTLNHAAVLCRAAGRPQNSMVRSIIWTGFLSHQVLTIRRITEPFDGQTHKAVYSLPRVIKEIAEQRKLITRELYVCVDGHQYDSREAMPRHHSFDELSGVSSQARNRDDLIDEIISRLSAVTLNLRKLSERMQTNTWHMLPIPRPENPTSQCLAWPTSTPRTKTLSR